MTQDQVKNTILRVLSTIAPEADSSTISPGGSLREQLDLDSVDFLNFIIALHKETGIAIPESDYSKVQSVDLITRYILDKMAEHAGG